MSPLFVLAEDQFGTLTDFQLESFLDECPKRIKDSQEFADDAATADIKARYMIANVEASRRGWGDDETTLSVVDAEGFCGKCGQPCNVGRWSHEDASFDTLLGYQTAWNHYPLSDCCNADMCSDAALAVPCELVYGGGE